MKNKKMIFLIIACFFSVGLMAFSFYKIGFSGKNKYGGAVSSNTSYYDYSSLTSIDNDYSYSTLFYTENTNIYAKTSGSGVVTTARQDVLTSGESVPMFTLNRVNATAQYIITNCAVDEETGELVDAIVEVKVEELWASDSNVLFTMDPTYLNGGSQVQPKRVGESGAVVKEKISNNDPISFFLSADRGQASVTVKYYKKINITSAHGTDVGPGSYEVGGVTTEENEAATITFVDSFTGNINTNMKKVNSFYYDIDVPGEYSTSVIMNGYEGVYPTSGTNSIYYKKNKRTVQDSNYGTLNLTFSEDENGVFIDKNGYFDKGSNINGIWYAMTAEFLTSDLQGQYTFNYVGTGCGLWFMYFSPKGYSIDDPIEKAPEVAYTGENWNYEISQYIPNNYYSNVVSFNSVYPNTFPSDNFLSSYSMKYSAGSNYIDKITVKSGYTLTDVNNNSISNYIGLHTEPCVQNSTKACTVTTNPTGNTSNFYKSVSAYNNVYKLTVPVTVPNPTETPYTITNKSSVTTKIGSNGTSVTKNSNTVSTEIRSPKVVYDCETNGGTGNTTIYHNVEDNIDLNKECSKPGSQFLGWSLTSEITSQSELVTSKTIPTAAELHADNSLETITLYGIYQDAITIKAKNQTKVYDGTSLDADSTCEITSGVLPTGYTYVCNNSGNQTAAGSKTKILNSVTIYNSNNDDVTMLFDVTKVNGTLEVTPRAVTCTSNSRLKTYDGTALTEPGGTCTNLASNHVAEFTNTGTRTDVTKKLGDVNLDGEINAADMTRQARIVSKIEPAKNWFVKVQADMDEDGDVDATDQTILARHVANIEPFVNQYKVPNTISNITIKSGNTDVTSNYTITRVEGELLVYPKEVSVSTSNQSKEYDGTDLVATNDCVASGLVNNQLITCSNSGSIKNVGSNPKTIDTVTIKEGNTPVTDNYIVNKTNGTLTITPKELTVTATNQSKTYDGTPLDADGTCTSVGLLNGDTVICTNSGTITDVGSVPKVIEGVAVKDSSGTDVTDNYTITKINGTLTIGNNVVTFKANNQSKTYTGTPLNANSTCTLVDGTLPAGFTYTCTNSGTITDVGSTTKTLKTVKIFDENNNNVTNNFTVTKQNGTLKINKRNTTCTSNSATKEYDGTALTAPGGTCTNLASNQTSTFTNTGSVINYSDSGINNNTIGSLVITDASSNDVTNNYNVTKVYGDLVITQKPIIVTTTNQSKSYDGTDLVATNDCASTGLFTNHSLTCTNSGTIRNVGSEPKVIETVIVLDENNADVTTNYNITKENGTLTIGDNVVTFKALNQTKVYDGTRLNADSTCELTSGTLPSGFTYTCNNTGYRLNVGSSSKKISTVTIYDDSDNDVTGNYTIIKENGILKVTKRAISVTTTDQTKVYDSLALTADNDCTANDLAENHVIVCTNSGEITNVGTETKGISIVTINDGSGTDVTANYTITKTNATLSVTPKSIVVKTTNQTKTYSGTPLVALDNCSSTDLETGHTISCTNSGEITNVGTETKTIDTIMISDSEDNDVTGNYTPVIMNGTLKVNKRNTICTSNSATKVYDGTALTKAGGTCTNLVKNQTATFTNTGSITNVSESGTSNNTISSVVIKDSSDADVTGNYNMTTVNGDLSITPKAIEVTTSNQSKEYDGTPLVATNDCASDGLISGHTLTCTNTGSITNKGTKPKVIDTVNITSGGNDITGNYSITKTNGTLTIGQKVINIKADDQIKVYDGTPLVGDNTCSITEGTLPAGYTYSCTGDGSQTNKGTSTKELTTVIIKNENDEDVTGNFTVVKQDGELEVTARRTTCTSRSDSKVYEGTPLTAEGGTCTNLVDGDTSEFENSGSITNVRESGTNNNTVDSVIIKNESGVDNSSNYDITIVYGDLSITPKAIEVTTTNQTKVYDGTPLDALDDCTASGISILDSITCSNSGTITDVGTEEKVIGTVTINNNFGEDSSDNYIITKTNGTLTVTKLAITVKALDQTKVYDRLPLDADETCELVSGTLVDGHTFTCTNSGSQTIVGTSTKTLEEVTIVRGGSLTDNYEITKLNGILEVTPLEYTITLDDQGADRGKTGTPKIIQICDDAIYLNKDDNKKMTSNENPIVLPEKTGYTFMGYYSSLDDDGVLIIDPEGYLTSNLDETMCDGNRTIYAKWRINEYKLTVIYNNGHPNDEYILKYKEQKEIEDPVKEYYTFIEWLLTGAGSTMENRVFTMGHEDAVIEATYIKTPKECDLVLKSDKYRIDEVNKIVYVALGETDEEIMKNVTSKGVIRPITNEKIVVVCDDNEAEYKISRYIVPHTGNERVPYIIILVTLGLSIIVLYFIEKIKAGK